MSAAYGIRACGSYVAEEVAVAYFTDESLLPEKMEKLIIKAAPWDPSGCRAISVKILR